MGGTTWFVIIATKELMKLVLSNAPIVIRKITFPFSS